MSPKTAATPLSTTASGNSRTRGAGKKSLKVRENEAQKKAGFSDTDGFSVLEDMPDADVTMIPETQLEPQSPNEASARIESKIDALTAMTVLFRAEINELKSIHRTEVTDLKKIVEQLQIELHEMREQAATTDLVRPPQPSYAAIAGSTQRPLPSGPSPIVLPMAEELYYTMDFSRVEHCGETVKAGPAALRKKIEEVQKQDENFRVKAVIKDRRSPDRLRVLCRNEEELKNVKSAAIAIATQGARVLRDQLYPVKINNARADAILMPDGSLKPNVASEIIEENNTEITKVAWLSAKHNGRAFGSLVAYFTRGSEATRFLRERYIYVGRESANVRVFEPKEGPLRCFNCHGFGHKAFNCQVEKICGKCAQAGHSWRECTASIPKCPSCSGPHEVISKACQFQHGR